MTQPIDSTMDTDRMPIDGLHRVDDIERRERRHRFWRFDPTVSTGTLLQLGTIAVAVSIGYATYREDRANTAAAIDQVKVTAIRDREEMKTAIESFRTDVKELKVKMDGVGENVAVLKAQSHR